MKIHKFDALDSTNTFLKENYTSYQSFDVIYTNLQTKGKGRRDRSWHSDEHGLTFSILVKEKLTNKQIQLIPFYTAMIVHKHINQITHKAMIKWPNDILINGKKAVGILVESLIQGDQTTLIIGIGINVNQQDFPEEITNIATSLQLESGQKINKEKLFNDIVFAFESGFDAYKTNQETILNYCNQFLAYKNKEITFNDFTKKSKGKCIEINASGHLVLEVNQAKQSYISGEIEILKNI